MLTPRALRITQHRYQMGEANRDAVLGDRPDKVEDADTILGVPLAPELAVMEQVIVDDHDRCGNNEPDKTKVFRNTVAKESVYFLQADVSHFPFVLHCIPRNSNCAIGVNNIGSSIGLAGGVFFFEFLPEGLSE